MRTNSWGRAIALLAMVGGIAACHVEVTEDDDYDDEVNYSDPYYSYHQSDLPTYLQSRAQLCHGEHNFRNGTSQWICFEDDDYRWRTSCRSSDCRSVPLYVHYVVQQELGIDRTVHIEAFDNRYFQGYPIGKVEITDFRARVGEYGQAELYLSPGEYYLRAYISSDDGDQIVPYQFDGMELVADRPVGVYGALSGVESIRVKPEYISRYPDPVHITINKLFHKPGEMPDTKAHLRLLLETDEVSLIPDGRDILIELHESSEINRSPLQSFRLASEALLVTGRVGKAEFVTPSLPVGSYVVFVYVDSNGNGFADPTELQQIYSKDGRAVAVSVEENRVVTLPLKLSALGLDGGTGE